MTEDDLHLALMSTPSRFDIPHEYADALIDSLNSEGALDHLVEEGDDDEA